jgi:hypothetical protein
MIDDIDEERMYVIVQIRKSTAKRLDALLKELKRSRRDVETLSDLLDLLVELYRKVQDAYSPDPSDFFGVSVWGVARLLRGLGTPSLSNC